jgi:hypothetical protein
MELLIRQDNTLTIYDARIIWKNFRGERGPQNRNGERKFNVVIANQEIADRLLAHTNDDGAAWNVRMKPPMDEGGDPLLYLEVKVRFNQYGPPIYVVSNGVQRQIGEEEVGMLDKMAIEKVDVAIRPYDNYTNGNYYRTAYLQSIRVYQREVSYDPFAEETPF